MRKTGREGGRRPFRSWTKSQIRSSSRVPGRILTAAGTRSSRLDGEEEEEGGEQEEEERKERRRRRRGRGGGDGSGAVRTFREGGGVSL